MRTAILIYVAPLTLLSLYVLMSVMVAHVSDCPADRAPGMPCRLGGLDVAPLLDAGGGAVALFAPMALAWLALGGIAVLLVRRLRERG
ncbi:hypothetical protein Ga0609869_000422 [Rhodovulum iodosum]|uniref:Uncharacterized protein n=1 Tax=Rhodovulum iodosum TaxID=68291 RepID=A0ABV3XPV1_9RHOB|nr:hypothetical protein [Rhodovulum robiginosum]RSK38010.1 hypothetical protein EJA01_03530 [Rhodovulum robiginosum]